ncbi:hypothetical protein NLG97_g5081 [Lecanicillium saksenae]|uniref:Uncharacterized protein n=1 Tax=Lecanicillium saksenae TaxID=468837 RepID=A0ACC1QTF3_9HYPO|nr:hypothetical protein NLG97_g5081 [Lecanicillium saksenae]
MPESLASASGHDAKKPASFELRIGRQLVPATVEETRPITMAIPIAGRGAFWLSGCSEDLKDMLLAIGIRVAGLCLLIMTLFLLVVCTAVCWKQLQRLL